MFISKKKGKIITSQTCNTLLHEFCNKNLSSLTAAVVRQKGCKDMKEEELDCWRRAITLAANCNWVAQKKKTKKRKAALQEKY